MRSEVRSLKSDVRMILYEGGIRLPTSDLRFRTSILLLEHQFLHFLLVFFFVLEIEHGAKDMIPYGGAYTITIVFIFVMMKMMITPKRFHPLERRVPGMNRIMHRSIHEISKKKTGEKYKCIATHDQIRQSKQG